MAYTGRFKQMSSKLNNRSKNMRLVEMMEREMKKAYSRKSDSMIKSSLKKSILICFIGLALTEATMLSGCTAFHSDYVRPELDEFVFVNGTSGMKSLNNQDSSEASANEEFSDNYWLKFNDPKLNALIDEALKSNNDYALWLKVSKQTNCYLLEENLAKQERCKQKRIR